MKQLPEFTKPETDPAPVVDNLETGRQSRKGRPKAKPSVKAKAVAYLAQREHSQVELARKLGRAGYEPDEIQEAMVWLATHQLQSDQRFSRSLARRRAGTYGNRAIEAELAQHGLRRDSVCLDETPDLPFETERIRSWLARKYISRLSQVLNEEGELDREALFQLKIKAFRALAARGFEQNNIQTSWTRFVQEFVSERC